MTDLAVREGKVKQSDFEAVLKAVKSKVSLDRAAWPGVAGAGGASRVAEAMIGASEPSEVSVAQSLESLNNDVSSDAITLS